LSYSCLASSPLLGHGYVLHNLSRTAFPSHGLPSPLGGTQALYKVCLPPPQATVHDDQS